MKNGVVFVVLLVVAVAASWFSLSPQHPVALGLDLRGGMRVTLEPDMEKLDSGQKIDAQTMQSVRDVIENRVNSFGLSGAEVRLKGDNQILVLLPGARNPQDALKIIVTVAQLELRHLNNTQTSRNPSARFKMNVGRGDSAKGEPDTYSFTDTADGDKPVAPDKVTEVVLKDTPLILRGSALKPTSRAEINPNNGQPYVSFELGPEGTRVFGDFTTGNQGEILAIVLDNKVISAPSINEPITEGHGQISGGFSTVLEAKVLANLLNSGSLPIPMKPVEIQTVGATLGQESIDKSIHAGLIGLGLVLVFMLAYYWLPGFLACIALLFYSVLTFAIFKGAGFLPPIVLDLPGITGFILSVGMAVDANILIFERLKEELRSGKNLHAAIDAGFNRAFSSILDSNVTTWIVCAILVWLGTPIIRGFAITLAIGVAVSMFTAITVTRTMLHLVVGMPWARQEKLFGLNVGWSNILFPGVRSGQVLDVYSKRKAYFGFSIVLSVLAIIFIGLTPFGMGIQSGIDFTGGSIIEVAFRGKDVPRAEIEKAIADQGIKDPIISVGQNEQPWTRVSIEATEVDKATQDTLPNRLATLRGYDPTGYTFSTDKNIFKASAVFVAEVAEGAINAALTGPDSAGSRLTLKNLKLQVTPESHAGSAAVPTVEIRSQALRPEKAGKLREALDKLGGGVIEPLYQQSSIGPSVAREVTVNAASSVVVASLAIILYLAFRFAIGGFLNGLKFGVCAVVALIHDVGVVIGLFALMGAVAKWQVDSLFVTAALTVIGFSVHDTIVVYDRIRENLRHRRRGETFADVSDRSITQTFDRSLNTSLTVLLVVAALVLFGGSSVRLFNVALLVGIAIGTYSSIFVASPLVVFLEQRLATAEVQSAARRREEPTLQRSQPRRDAGVPAPKSSRPQAPAAPRPQISASEGEGEAEQAAAARSRLGPATVRPKKKRRL
jgi:protein-export membrane protein SecD/preprotein translocase SecF subunit